MKTFKYKVKFLKLLDLRERLYWWGEATRCNISHYKYTATGSTINECRKNLQDTLMRVHQKPVTETWEIQEVLATQISKETVEEERI